MESAGRARGRLSAVAWPIRTSLTRGRAWLWLLILGTLLVGVWAIAPPALAQPLAGLFLVLPALVIPIGLRLHRPARARSWWLIGLGLGIIAIAAIGLGMATGQGTNDDRLTFLTALLIVGLVVRLVGFCSLVRGRGGVDRGTLLDVAVVAVVGALLLWFTVLEQPTKDGRVDASMVLTLGLDLALLVMAVRLALGPGRRLVAFWALLGASVLTMGADLALAYLQSHGSYRPPSLTDAGWYLGSVTWAVAALHPSMVRLTKPEVGRPQGDVNRLAVAAMAAAAMTVPALLFVSGPHDLIEHGVIAFGAAATTGLVLARLSIMIGQIRRGDRTRALLEVELRAQALRDPVTGVGNRLAFDRWLGQALDKDPIGIAVLCCDLDDFATVNDSVGRFAGDQILVDAASRLRSAFGPDETVARVAGDQFALLLRGTPDAAAAVRAAARIAAVFEAPFLVDGQSTPITASVGVGFAPAGADDTGVMGQAEIALYLAKAQGKGQHELFRPALHTQAVSRLALRTSLIRAVDEREFRVHYQPIIDLRTLRTVAVEALVRWQHPLRGIVLPGEFIAAAEASGLILRLGQQVLEEACRQLVAWSQAGYVDLATHVNLSPLQLRHPTIVDDIRGALSVSGLYPHRLVLEVTETSVVDIEEGGRVLAELRRLGVRLAVDDFGTGYSALSYLAHLPLDVIKIDRSFVQDLTISEGAATLTKHIIELADQFGLEAIAEGVETEGQLDSLRRLGCRFAQGYLFSRPVEPAVCLEFLRAEDARRVGRARPRRSSGDRPQATEAPVSARRRGPARQAAGSHPPAGSGADRASPRGRRA